MPLTGEKDKLGIMKQKIGADASFQVLSHAFSFSPSTQPFYLQLSADGLNWTDFPSNEEAQELPSGETIVCVDCAFGQYIRLDGYIPQDENGDPAEFGTLIY